MKTTFGEQAYAGASAVLLSHIIWTGHSKLDLYQFTVVVHYPSCNFTLLFLPLLQLDIH